jgi:hypothetical protein
MFWKKNRGFNDLKKNSRILIGEKTSMEGLPDDLNENDLAHFKYAPITSSIVERSFSCFKNILSDNRRSFDMENIKKILIVQCNTFTGMTVTIHNNHPNNFEFNKNIKKKICFVNFFFTFNTFFFTY